MTSVGSFKAVLSHPTAEVTTVRATDIPIRLLVYGLALMVVLSAGAAPAGAQEGQSPSVTLSAADIDLDVGETTQVTATYEFAVEDPGSGDAALSAISGTMWLFPGNDVGDITAKVDGQEVDPSVDRGSRHMTLSVPVEDVSAGDTVRVELSYAVSGTAGELKAPLWTPEYETTGTEQVVQLTATLPEGQQVQGSAFPALQDESGSEVSAGLLHMPGFVTFEYGSQPGSLLTLDVLSTLIGVVLIVGLLGGWLAWTRGLIGGERHVA